MKVSLIQTTNKVGGIDILKDNLARQTFKDFEVVLVDELSDWRGHEVKEYLKDFNLKYYPSIPKKDGDAWNFNSSMNIALEHCAGNFIISLQDYIWIPANGIQRFVDDIESEPNSFISGVGHKFENPKKIDFPHKISAFHKLYRPSHPLSEFDDRMLLAEGLQPAQTSLFELNWSCFPNNPELRFDPDMDKFYGCDNIYLEVVGKQLGMKSFIDRSNVCWGYNQSLFGRPMDWEERHGNKGAFSKFLWSKGYKIR